MKDYPTSSNEESSKHKMVVADNNVDEAPAKTLNENGENFDYQTHTSTKPITRTNKSVKRTGGSKYPCNKCEYKTTSNRSLSPHIQIKHEPFQYRCENCDYKAITQSILEYHKQNNKY